MYCLTGARCSSQAENYYMTGRGFVFFPFFFCFIFIVFAVLLRGAVLSLSYSSIQQAYQKRKRITPPQVYMYARHVSERRGRRRSGNRPRREAYVASDLSSPEAWRDSWHCQVASLQLKSIMKNYIQSWTSVRFA